MTWSLRLTKEPNHTVVVAVVSNGAKEDDASEDDNNGGAEKTRRGGGARGNDVPTANSASPGLEKGA